MARQDDTETMMADLKDPTEKEKMEVSQQAPLSPEPSPEWLEALRQLLDKIDPKDAEQAVKDVEAFVEGDMSWAEVQGIPRQALFEMAEQGYLKFKSGRLKEAGNIFRSLCTLDHRTGYYHTAMGAIHQKKKNFFDALAEYTVALELDPEDLTAYANRGEVYYMMGLDEQPLKDFEEAIQRDPEGKDPWANRARFIKKQILELRGES